MRVRGVALLVAVCLSASPVASAQAPSSVSTPVLRETPSGGLYLDRDFGFEKTLADVVYATKRNAAGETEDLLLDVWEPAGHAATDRPAVVWISGGGFTNVSKDGPGVRNRIRGWVERGYVVASITYRVRPETGPGSFGNIVNGNPVEFTQEAIGAIRDATEDAKDAVRWVRVNAAQIGVDPGRIAVAGWSAGGITALGVAFDAGPGSEVSAAISGAGAYAPLLQGAAIEPGEPPMQMFHGTNDVTVPLLWGLEPCLNTLVVGNVCEAHIYPGGGHGLGEHLAHYEAKTASFLYRHVVAPQPFPMDR